MTRSQGKREPPVCVHCGGQHEDFMACAREATGHTDSASRVASDPDASKAEKMADKAHDAVIVLNHILDPNYAPYCMRCSGLHRMRVVEPFYWMHDRCGAVHDERQVLLTDEEKSHG